MVDSLTGRRDKDRLGTDKDRDSQGRQMEHRGEDGTAACGEPQGSALVPAQHAKGWLIVLAAAEGFWGMAGTQAVLPA